MNIVIVGNGAIGLLLASKLLPNKQVNLALQARQHSTGTHEFTATNIDGYSQRFAVKAATNIDYQQAQLLLVCLKSFDVKTVLAQYLPLLSENCQIVLCHNGMGVYEDVIALGANPDKVLTLLTTHGALKASAHHVIHTGLGEFDIGSYQPLSENSYTAAINALLTQQLAPINWHQDIRQKQWLKLAINCLINPITATENIANGDVVQTKYRQTLTNLAQEISSVAARANILFSGQDILDIALNVARATAKNTSSMRADVLNKRPTEIDYINGFIVELAKQDDIDVPVNQTLVKKVKETVSPLFNKSIINKD